MYHLDVSELTMAVMVSRMNEGQLSGSMLRTQDC